MQEKKSQHDPPGDHRKPKLSRSFVSSYLMDISHWWYLLEFFLLIFLQASRYHLFYKAEVAAARTSSDSYEYNLADRALSP